MEENTMKKKIIAVLLSMYAGFGMSYGRVCNE